MIELHEVTKIYNLGKENEYNAINDISLELPNTGLVLICGESGSGKTTLLNLIAKIDDVTFGEIIGPSENNYASFVFQDFQLIDNMSVYENLKLITSLEKLDSSRIDELLNHYHLVELKNHKANELSGGQKQRIGIIRAILSNRPVICCDEPTASLDSHNSLEIAALLKECSKDRLVIISSHNLELFKSLADHMITLEDGLIVNEQIINDTKDKTNIVSYNKKSSRLSFKQTLNFSIIMAKIAPFRFIIMSICLIITLSLAHFCINLSTNSYSMNKYTAYRDANYSTLELFAKNSNSESNVKNLLERKKDDVYDFFDVFLDIDNPFTLEKIHDVKRVFIGDKSPFPLIAGENELQNNDIIITDYYANRIFGSVDYSKIINESISLSYGEYHNIYKIVGIINTNYNKSIDIKKTNNTLYRKVVMNHTTAYNSIYEESVPLPLINNAINVPTKKTRDSLAKNEVVLSTINAYYFSALNDLASDDVIGKSINLRINDYEESFTIVGIEEENYVSTSLRRELYLQFCFDLLVEKGIAIDDYSYNDLKQCLNGGFVTSSYLDEGINTALEHKEDIESLEIVFIIVLIVLFTSISIILVSFFYSKSKSLFGILKAHGVKNISCIGIMSLLIGIIYISSLMLSFGLQYIYIILMNNLFISKNYLDNNFFYYNYNSILFATAIIMIMFLMINIIIYCLSNRKKSVDLIREG